MDKRKKRPSVAERLAGLLALEPQERQYDFPCLTKLGKLRVNKSHEGLLRRVLKLPGAKGGLGAKLLVRAVGADAVEPVVAALERRPLDYNLGSEAGEALAPHADAALAERLLAWLGDVVLDTDGPLGETGAVVFTARMLAAVEPVTVVALFHDSRRSAAVVAALCEWAGDDQSEVSLRLLTELLVAGRPQAIFALHLRTVFDPPNRIAALAGRDAGEIHALCETLARVLREPDRPGDVRWALALPADLSANDRVAAWRRALAAGATGTLEVGLAATEPSGRHADPLGMLRTLLANRAVPLTAVEAAHLQPLSGADWTAHADLLLSALDRDDTALTGALLDAVNPIALPEPLARSWVPRRRKGTRPHGSPPVASATSWPATPTTPAARGRMPPSSVLPTISTASHRRCDPPPPT